MRTTLRTYHTKQEIFEGPLDLLLDLIEREKLPINEISLAKVTDDFLAHIRGLEIINQETLADFLVVAAELMLIKSRSLLPQLELSSEEEESADDLARRLAEYQRLKELAKLLGGLDRRQMHIYSRAAYMGLPIIFHPPPRLVMPDMVSAFQAIIASLPQPQILAEEKIRKVISLEEKIRDIQNRLSQHLTQAFSALVHGSKEKIEVVISFLAILELAKQKLVTLDQEGLFKDIVVQHSTQKP